MAEAALVHILPHNTEPKPASHRRISTTSLTQTMHGIRNKGFTLTNKL